MSAGVPSGMWRSSHAPCAKVSRMQPWLTGSPIELVSGVEWIATRLPPLQPWIACGARALSASTQQP